MSSGLGVWCLPRGWRTTHSNRSIWPQPIPIWFQLQNLISHWICNTQSRMQTILVFAIVNACNKAYRRSRRRLWWKCLSTDTHTNTHSLQSRLALLCTEKSNSTTYLFIGEKKSRYTMRTYIFCSEAGVSITSSCSFVDVWWQIVYYLYIYYVHRMWSDAQIFARHGIFIFRTERR